MFRSDRRYGRCGSEVWNSKALIRSAFFRGFHTFHTFHTCSAGAGGRACVSAGVHPRAHARNWSGRFGRYGRALIYAGLRHPYLVPHLLRSGRGES
jgi:hypothetical protein